MPRSKILKQRAKEKKVIAQAVFDFSMEKQTWGLPGGGSTFHLVNCLGRIPSEISDAIEIPFRIIWAVGCRREYLAMSIAFNDRVRPWI